MHLMQRWIVTRRWLRNLIKRWFWLYDISDLVVGGHCGCCGAWVPLDIVEKGWAITVCEQCKHGEEAQ